MSEKLNIRIKLDHIVDPQAFIEECGKKYTQKLKELSGIVAPDAIQDINFAEGVIVYDYLDKTQKGTGQLVGSFSRVSDTFLWAWGNEQIASQIKTEDSLLAKDFGEKFNLSDYKEANIDLRSPIESFDQMTAMIGGSHDPHAYPLSKALEMASVAAELSGAEYLVSQDINDGQGVAFFTLRDFAETKK
jgi:hypothetical protein